MASEIKVDTIVNAGGDNDSGIDLATNDQVKVKIANAEDFIFKANSLEVQTGSNIDMNGTELILDADADTSITADTDDQIDFKTGGSDTFRVNSASVSIVGGSAGTASVNIPAGDILSDVSSGQFEIANLGDSSSELRLSSRGFVAFRTGGSGLNAGTERMRMNSSGLVLIGNTVFNNSDNAIALHSNAGSTGHNIQLNRGSTDTKNQIAFSNPNGQVGTIQTAGSGTSYNTSSDYRLKENVVTDWDATSRLKQLKPSRFNFIADADTTVDGFLAHEVSSIVPEAISGEKDAVDADGNPEYQGIDQSKLVPLLTKALQEAMARIETLEAKVTALESE
jgi:hypothetical protein